MVVLGVNRPLEVKVQIVLVPEVVIEPLHV